MILLFRILILTAILGSVASTLSVYPHQLAYFNEASGGPENGYKHLLGSNLDWGQDVFHVAERAHDYCSIYLTELVDCPFQTPGVIAGPIPIRSSSDEVTTWLLTLPVGFYIVQFSRMPKLGIELSDLDRIQNSVQVEVLDWTPSLFLFVKS